MNSTNVHKSVQSEVSITNILNVTDRNLTEQQIIDKKTTKGK